jgi:hypothetical protein
MVVTDQEEEDNMSDTKTLPFKTEDLQKLFTDKSHVNIDVKNSQLKGAAFIAYITNMRIECSLLDDVELPFEEKETLLKEFLKTIYATDCDTLLHCLAFIMLTSRGIETEPFCTWLSKEEAEKFIGRNTEIVQEISDFIDSLLVACLSFNSGFKEHAFTKEIENGTLTVVDESSLFGTNVLGLITIPDFIEIFIGHKQDDRPLKYYKAQIEDLTYKRNTVFDLLVKIPNGSPLMSMVNLLLSDKEEEIEIKEKYFLKGA